MRKKRRRLVSFPLWSFDARRWENGSMSAARGGSSESGRYHPRLIMRFVGDADARRFSVTYIRV